MGGSDRDLKMKEAVAMGGGDRDLKFKEAAAMERGCLNLKLHSVAIGEGFHELWIGGGDRDPNTKMKDAGVDTLKRNERSRPWEVKGGILKLKKEATVAMDLWFNTRSPSRQARKAAQEKAQALGAGKKKMKVVKSKLPKELIDHMASYPMTLIEDFSEEDFAQCTPDFRQIYAAAKLYEAKDREYWYALIAQQKELGYAEDEIEVTDDEEEAVVKN